MKLKLRDRDPDKGIEREKGKLGNVRQCRQQENVIIATLLSLPKHAE